jgi:uncharacterized protein
MSEDFSGKRYVIAGGNGFLGKSLACYLADRGASVTILSRRPTLSRGSLEYVEWDGRTLGNWVQTLERADGLVNLTGRSVSCIKTPDHRDEIFRSRVESTRVLGTAMRSASAPPPVWVQMSTAHIYGDPPDAVCDEDSAEGCGFAPLVGRAWEAAFAESLLSEQRGVVLRTAFVIGRDRGAGGGALATLGRLARWGLGGRVGKGTQGMSWIHDADLNRIIARGLANPAMRGVYNASSPRPVSQIEFMRVLRRAVGMPLGLPAAAWMVRLGATFLLRTDPELALYGRYVLSRRLADEGFDFHFPELPAALAEIYGPQASVR